MLRAIALAGFPLSLTSPGATIVVAVIGIYGIYQIARGDRLDDDLKRAAWLMMACYSIVVAADLINGGGINNVGTAINYLPLLALAPFSHSMRRLDIGIQQVLCAICVGLIFLLMLNIVRYEYLGVARPGGINLAPIGLGMVLAVQITFMIPFLFMRMVPIYLMYSGLISGSIALLLTQSKIAVGSLIISAVTIGIIQYFREGYRAKAIASMLIIIPIVVFMIHYFMYSRILRLWEELVIFAEGGGFHGSSFGHRYEQIVAGLRAFVDRPLIGYGFEERMDAVYRHASDGGPDVSFLAYIHNDYITHLVSFGLLGVAFIVAYFLATALTIGAVKSGPMRHGGWGVLVGLAVYMTAEVAFNMDPITGVTTIVLGTIIGLGSSDNIDSAVVRDSEANVVASQ